MLSSVSAAKITPSWASNPIAIVILLACGSRLGFGLGGNGFGALIIPRHLWKVKMSTTETPLVGLKRRAPGILKVLYASKFPANAAPEAAFTIRRSRLAV